VDTRGSRDAARKVAAAKREQWDAVRRVTAARHEWWGTTISRRLAKVVP
jgi:hypothetical protein